MSPAVGNVLLQAQQIIRAYLARGAVRAQDDIPELAADGTAQAARILDSCVRNAKPVPAANSVAHYVIASMRSGRRHGYSGRLDVMCPAAQLDGSVSLAAMDAPVGASDDDGNELTLHDSIASDSEDVDVAVARHLDWGLVDMDPRRRAVLRETAEGYGPDEIALHLGVSAPRVVQLRQSCRSYILDAWGSSGIQDTSTPSRWRQGMRASAERRAGRAERRA